MDAFLKKFQIHKLENQTESNFTINTTDNQAKAFSDTSKEAVVVNILSIIHEEILSSTEDTPSPIFLQGVEQSFGKVMVTKLHPNIYYLESDENIFVECAVMEQYLDEENPKLFIMDEMGCALLLEVQSEGVLCHTLSGDVLAFQKDSNIISFQLPLPDIEIPTDTPLWIQSSFSENRNFLDVCDQAALAIRHAESLASMDTFIPSFQAFRDALNTVEKKRITVEASRILERIDQFLHDVDETKPSFAEIQSILIDRDRLESLCLYGIRETRAIQIQIEDIDKDLSDWLEGWEPTGVDNRAIEERLWKAQIESPEHYWGANAIRNHL